MKELKPKFIFQYSQADIFLANIDNTLSLFENINTLYSLLNFNQLILWMRLHKILRHYFNQFIYDVARDGSWIMINNEKYLFDSINSVVEK
jgi:hypothetical protein